VEICLEIGIDGIIATNTTIEREGLKTAKARIKAIGAGGLSGQAVRKHSTEVISFLHKISEGKLPIVGVGGIDSPKHALEKMEAGASLIQLYTGFVYEGPAIIGSIKQSLLDKYAAEETVKA